MEIDCIVEDNGTFIPINTSLSSSESNDNDDNSPPLTEDCYSDSSSCNCGSGSPHSEPTARLHPLLNPLILTRLFSYCTASPRLLANCRLVCRLWRDVSLASWRSSLPIKLMTMGDQIYLTIYRDLSKETPIEDFLKYVENPYNNYNLKPHREYHLIGWEFSQEHEIFQRFQNLVGESVTTLKLESCKFHEVNAFRNVVYQSFPNLERLILNSCYLKSNHPPQPPNNVDEVEEPFYKEHLNLRSLSIHQPIRFGDPFPVSFFELLSHFLSLTSLKLSGEKHPLFYENAKELLNAIKTIREVDKRKLQISNFETLPILELSKDPVSQEIFDLYRQLHIPLKSLRVSAHPELNDGNIVKEVLECHRATIERITVVQDTIERMDFRWRFPLTVELPNLQELDMRGVLCENLEFLKYTPNLKRLVMIDSQRRALDGVSCVGSRETITVSSGDEAGLGDVKLLNLKEIRMDCVLSEEDLEILVKWMPKVEVLEMALNAKQFEIICKHSKNLEELTILEGELTDEAVTGRDLSGDLEQAAVGEPVRSNITNLQSRADLLYLKTFLFFQHRLTDASVFHGFILLPNLMRVQASANPMRFGEEARKALRDRNIWIYKVI